MSVKATVRRTLARTTTSCVLVIFVMQGCSSTRLPGSLPDAGDAGKIAVVHAAKLPEIRLAEVILLDSAGEGANSRLLGVATEAAKGATPGLMCVGGGLSNSGSCSGAFCGGLELIIIATCGVVTIAGVAIGTVRGAVAAGDQPSAAAPPQLSTVSMKGPQELSSAYIQFALRNAVEQCLLQDNPAALVRISETVNDGPLTDEGRQYLMDLGTRTVLTTSLDAVTLVATPDGQRKVLMHATAVASRARDGNILGSAHFSYASEPKTLRNWRENNASALLVAIQAGYSNLSAQVCHTVTGVRTGQ